MNEDEEVKEGSVVCPECGGEMVEDEGDESMVKCEKCGYRMTADQALPDPYAENE